MVQNAPIVMQNVARYRTPVECTVRSRLGTASVNNTKRHKQEPESSHIANPSNEAGRSDEDTSALEPVGCV